jgi:chaperonin GroES
MTKAVRSSVATEKPFEGTEQDYKDPLKIQDILDAQNIADLLSKDDLITIGNDAVSGFNTDLASREPWEKDLEQWTKLALQISDMKSYPWVGAANIKFPLLATAAMQFAARAYPTLVPSNGQIVKCKIIGYDPDGEKTKRADRISKHMSYQILDDMPDWEEDMDKLLISLPIAGTCFKKTYWDAAKQKNCSHLVLPKYLVVNYNTRSLDEAERITEVMQLTKRQIKERINRKIFLDISLGDPTGETTFLTNSTQRSFQLETSEDDTTPYTILEQHTYLDLDGDGYTEPYIVTVDENTRKVLRIVPRFDKDTVIVNEKKKVVSIEAIQYYTKYSFIPNPDGGFYDIGFGRLLGPINDSANTIINQLVDAGSLSNLQAGFIGKGLRIKMGETRFQPGEWKAVNATGDDIKKQVFPLPVREPSEVLFKLLDLMLRAGKELASVAEIMTGKMPGQNTPATTTMATIDQGMKVFTAVYKRVYRSLTKEFRKIYKLNQTYLNPEEYIAIIDVKIEQSDYQGSEEDVIPGADPTAVSAQERQAKVQALMQILQLGTLDPMKVTQAYLEAHEIPQADQYLKQPSPPPPDPKMEALKLKSQLEQQKATHGIQVDAAKLQLAVAGQQQDMQQKAEAYQMDMQFKLGEHILKARQADAEHRAGLVQNAQKAQVGLAVTAAQAAQKMEIQKNQPKPKGK